VTVEQGLAIIIVAIITAFGSIYATRRSAKNERSRIDQTMVTVLGTERREIADELDKVQARAQQQELAWEGARAELRAIKEEYSEARISHREVIAEKDAAIRELQATVREFQSRLTENDSMLNATRTELGQARSELQNALTLIHQQAQALQAARNPQLPGAS
jgi:chromosome segregation ATPase